MLEYDRIAAVAYARRWAFSRNPLFTDFEDLGGDCTNFVSQCLYAGSGIMNYTPIFGWYFISLDDRSASWSGVQFLYNFLVGNEGAGPFGRELPLSESALGDVIQLNLDGGKYGHTVLVTDILRPKPRPQDILIASHSYDAYNRPLNTYNYKEIRLIHIEGVRPPETL